MAADVATPAPPIENEPNEEDSFGPFEPETAPIPPPPVRRHAPSRRIPVAVGGVCAFGLGAWLFWQVWNATPPASASVSAPVGTGTAEFHSVPEGASVAIDGKVRGVTPLRLALPAGTHDVTLASGSVSRTLPLTVAAGGTVSQYVELPSAPAVVGGRLEIGSEPPGAQVAVDGVPKGRTPLALSDVVPGQYRITVSAGDSVVHRTVSVRPSTTSALVVSMAPVVAANAAAGWLAIVAPVDMDIREDGRVLGTTRTERLMLPVGSHRIELANAGLEFTTARTVQIVAGKTATVSIPLPSGRLSVNAVPWADVSLDGAPLGTTPLGDVSVPIGVHELVFRHPQFGERRQTVTVKAQSLARIGIDLRK